MMVYERMICPLIMVCSRKVDIDTYINVCTNVKYAAYKSCDEYVKISKEAKTPADWNRMLSTPK